MKKNEATTSVNIDEAVEYLDIASDSLGELLDNFESEYQHGNSQVTVDAEEIISKLKYAKQRVDEAWFDLPKNGADDINDWKDIVISTLPAGASVAMANDVEDALDKFTHVY